MILGINGKDCPRLLSRIKERAALHPMEHGAQERFRVSWKDSTRRTRHSGAAQRNPESRAETSIIWGEVFVLLAFLSNLKYTALDSGLGFAAPE